MEHLSAYCPHGFVCEDNEQGRAETDTITAVTAITSIKLPAL